MNDNPDYIIYTHHIHINAIKRALDLVKNYIIKNDMILVGGLAIHMALERKGSELYQSFKVPDYDALTPDPVGDAYALASELCKDGLENVSAIPAKHMTTMRVRVQYEAVADFTFCPRVIFNKIRTLTGESGMRIRHPDYQRAEMHSAIALPYENTPMETILFRAKKDMTRFDIIATAYPIKIKKLIDQGKIPNPATSKTLILSLDVNDISDIMLWGYAAYAAIYTGYKASLGDEIDDNIIPANMKLTGNLIEWDSPVDRIDIASYNFTPLLDSLKSVKYINSVLDVLPRYIEGKLTNTILRIYDTSQLMIASGRVTDIAAHTHIANAQYTLMWLMAQYVYHDQKIALAYYASLERLVTHYADWLATKSSYPLTQLTKHSQTTDNKIDVCADDAPVYNSIILPTPKYYGIRSVSDTVAYSRDTTADDRPVVVTHSKKSGTKCIGAPAFDYTADVFQSNGGPSEPFTPYSD